MKKIYISYKVVILTSILLFYSCVEWSEILTFEIINKTGNEIIFIRHGGIYNNDTTKIAIDNSLVEISGGGIGNAIPDPFYNCKTIILIYQDSIVKEYFIDSLGYSKEKSPFDIEYYKETSRKETKKQTSITYEYLIEISDF